MRLTMPMAVGLASALLAVAVLPQVPVSGDSIRILFDFGDGTYLWASETIPDPSAINATWLAVQRAAAANGVSIESTWYACCGVAIADIGDRHSPAGFVGLYEWNASARTWEFTSSGISGFVVREDASIALYNAGYDSVTFAGRTPVPNPDHPTPAIEFRSDLGNTGATPSSAPNAVRLAWDRDTGVREIEATPAVAYGTVFVNTRRGVLALDEFSGATIWNQSAARGFSSPSIFDDSVIVGTSDGTVVRLNASDGDVQWETRLLTETLFSGITSSPKVAFDRVLIGTFNESGGPGEVFSIWASNGTVAWRHPAGSVHYSSAAYSDGVAYVGIMGTYNTTSQVTFDPPYGVLALDAATGTEKWFFETGGSIAASPAISGSRLIAPSKDGNVYAIDRATGALVWQAAVDAGVSSPAVVGDSVILGGGSFGTAGRVVALDSATGVPRWSYIPNGPVQASVTYADGKAFFATNAAHGSIYALNATTGAPVWSFEPSPSEYIFGSPVVADGMVFAPSDNGHMYALGPAIRLAEPIFIPVLVGFGVIGLAIGVAVAVVQFWKRSRGGRVG